MFFQSRFLISISSTIILALASAVFFVSTAIAFAQELETTPSLEPFVAADTSPLPNAPTLVYESIPNQELWYATTSALFTWTLPPDVLKVALVVSDEPETEPQVSYDPPIEGVSLTERQLTDGLHYLHVQFKNAFGWGEVLHRKILIDTAPPLPFEVTAAVATSPDVKTALYFDAVDELSGIEYYEVIVGGEIVDEVLPADIEDGYRFIEPVDGVYEITVRAYDSALNWRESNGLVAIVGGEYFNVADAETAPVVTTEYTNSAVAGLFVFTTLWLLIYLLYMRKRFADKEAHLRKETKEVEKQMEKIFTLLRDEIYTQINALSDKKSKLTVREKAAVKGLNSVLAVSESVLQSEIADVETLLTKKGRKKK